MVDQLCDAGGGFLDGRLDVGEGREDFSDVVGEVRELREELGVALDLVVRQLRRDRAQAGRQRLHQADVGIARRIALG